jgi:TatD DNase family protein
MIRAEAPVLTDTHAHLNHSRFAGDLAQVIDRARQAGVARVIVPGYDLPSSRDAVALAREHDGVWAAVGVHPHDASTLDDAALTEIRALAREPRVVAVGESGLDYHYDHSPRAVQRAAFEAHAHLARELGLPLIVHTREASDDALAVLGAAAPEVVILHCFSGDEAVAARAVERGYYIGLAGPLTFPNAGGLRAIAAGLPRDRVLVETDCPYLAPAPHRGQRNEPAYVALVAGRLAELWSEDPAQVAEITSANAQAAFQLG